MNPGPAATKPPRQAQGTHHSELPSCAYSRGVAIVSTAMHHRKGPSGQYPHPRPQSPPRPYPAPAPQESPRRQPHPPERQPLPRRAYTAIHPPTQQRPQKHTLTRPHSHTFILLCAHSDTRTQTRPQTPPSSRALRHRPDVWARTHPPCSGRPGPAQTPGTHQADPPGKSST